MTEKDEQALNGQIALLSRAAIAREPKEAFEAGSEIARILVSAWWRKRRLADWRLEERHQ